MSQTTSKPSNYYDGLNDQKTSIATATNVQRLLSSLNVPSLLFVRLTTGLQAQYVNIFELDSSPIGDQFYEVKVGDSFHNVDFIGQILSNKAFPATNRVTQLLNSLGMSSSLTNIRQVQDAIETTLQGLIA